MDGSTLGAEVGCSTPEGGGGDGGVDGPAPESGDGEEGEDTPIPTGSAGNGGADGSSPAGGGGDAGADGPPSPLIVFRTTSASKTRISSAPVA